MILGINGIIAGKGSLSMDTDAQAFITAASITDTTQQSAINKLVWDLKGANIWTKMKAVYPFVGGTASSHKFNLKDPRDLDAAYRLVFNGGWNHSSTGALPNGTNAYANTFLKPNAMGQNNAHVSFYSRTDVSRSSPDISAWAGGSVGGINLYLRTSSNNTYYFLNDNNNLKYVSSSSSIGFFNASRTTGTNVAMFKNGVKIDNGAGSSTVPSAYNIYLSAENNVGVVGSYSNRESAFASIGDGLTDTEAANLYTAVQTFQTTLGRQV